MNVSRTLNLITKHTTASKAANEHRITRQIKKNRKRKYNVKCSYMNKEIPLKVPYHSGPKC